MRAILLLDHERDRLGSKHPTIDGQIAAIQANGSRDASNGPRGIEFERGNVPDRAIVWQHAGDTAEAAIDRWRAARPGEPVPADPLLIRWEPVQ